MLESADSLIFLHLGIGKRSILTAYLFPFFLFINLPQSRGFVKGLQK